MSDPELELLECVLKSLSSGKILTRELVADCYGDSNEPQNVSDGWIDFFYEQLDEIPHSELLQAAKSQKKMIDLLHKILT